MSYLVAGFSVVWVCHFAYLFMIDRQARQLHRRLDARTRETASNA